MITMVMSAVIRERIAHIIELVHFVVGFSCTFGWLFAKHFWKAHLVLCFCVLAGWSAFGSCFLSKMCCYLRETPVDKSYFLLGPRRKLLGVMFREVNSYYYLNCARLFF